MSRLTKWLVKFSDIKGRKQAGRRVYHSEALASRMRLVKQEQGGKRRTRKRG